MSPESRPKKPYEPPAIQTEEIFETTALACAKRPGQSAMCNTRAKNS